MAKAKKKPAKAKVLIVDDHPIVRAGLAELINRQPDLTVCGQAEDRPQAMRAIAKLNPDTIVTDLSLGQSSGLELVKDIRARWPRLPILVLSMHDEAVYAERCIRAGARGYVLKGESNDKLLDAVRRVLGGHIHLSDSVTAHMLDKISGSGPSSASAVKDEAKSTIDALSDRELEVFRLIGEGVGTRDIAQKLHLSPKTIETYREHIKTKLGLGTAAELLRFAIQWDKSGNL